MAISDIVGRTVNDFADYAIAIVTIMLVYYAIRFFMVAPPTKEEREEAEKERQRKAKDFREYVGGKYTEKTQKSKRYHQFNPIRAYIIRAEQAVEELRDDELKEQSVSAVKNAQGLLKVIERNLKNIKRTLRAIRHHAKGDGWEFVNDLYIFNQALLENFIDHVKNSCPDAKAQNWDSKVNQFKKNIGEKLFGQLGYFLKVVDAHIENGATENPNSRRGPGGSA